MRTHYFLLLVLGIVLTVSCKREYDSPPVKQIPVGDVITLTDLRNMYQGTPIKFKGDTSIFCVVTADEQSGNLYKQFFATDGTSALNIRLLSSGGIYIGDSLRINLKETVLSQYNGMLQLDSVDVNENIVKQATNITVTPVQTTIDQITPAMQGQLIELQNVEFKSTDWGLTYADAINQQSMNRTLTDCYSNTVLVRTSGYADFAGDPVPTGNGTFLAIVGQYNSDMQLLIRDPEDLTLNNQACGGVPPGTYLWKDWEDEDLTSGGWITQLVTGILNWEASDVGAGSWYAKMSNYNGSNNASEAWLISPAIDLSASTTPLLSFMTASNYSGANLEVYVSTDYDGFGAPGSATWTILSPILSGGSWNWTSSGTMDLSSYKSTATYIGFKYTGTVSDGKTWELDDVLIQEQ